MPKHNQQENTMRERFKEELDQYGVISIAIGGSRTERLLNFIEKETALVRNQAISECIESVEKLKLSGIKIMSKKQVATVDTSGSKRATKHYHQALSDAVQALKNMQNTTE